jgi:hypothetical protein
MKEKPILFNTDMVRAILDGSKTQTRRPVKHQPAPNWDEAVHVQGHTFRFQQSSDVYFGGYTKCPLSVGDVLWVRETWSDFWMREDTHDRRLQRVHYRASWDGTLADDPPWRPSIHMPKWACRLRLRVTRVWAERVQDISEEDALAEGVDMEGSDASMIIDQMSAGYQSDTLRTVAQTLFRDLWRGVYGQDSWRNDWVWACEFEKVEV